MSCCAVFYVYVANSPSGKQIHHAPQCGQIWLAVLAAVVLFQLINPTGAAKLRTFRDGTSNVWALGKASDDHPIMAAGPDRWLYVLTSNGLFKLDVDAKDWHIIETRGLVTPSGILSLVSHRMVFVGDDMHLFWGFHRRSANSQPILFFGIVSLLDNYNAVRAP